MNLVVSIDVGIKNLGICAFDFVSNKVVFWDNACLVPGGRYLPAMNVEYVRNFVNKHQGLFANASVVLVERQMRCNMRIIESILQTMFFEKCYVISPRCIKVHYDISTRNYRSNKAKAVDWANNYVDANPFVFATEPCVVGTHHRFEGIASKFKNSSKKDDLADALLMVMYFLDTYSNQLRNE